MLKKILENPVGTLVGAIIVLVLIASFLPQILTIAAVILGIIVIVMVLRWLLQRGRPAQAGPHCTNCGHVTHGRQQCNQCRCAHS